MPYAYASTCCPSLVLHNNKTSVNENYACYQFRKSHTHGTWAFMPGRVYLLLLSLGTSFCSALLFLPGQLVFLFLQAAQVLTSRSCLQHCHMSFTQQTHTTFKSLANIIVFCQITWYSRSAASATASSSILCCRMTSRRLACHRLGELHFQTRSSCAELSP